jgi:acyl-CoA oxidase
MQVRNPDTMMTLPGISIWDMGEKLGQNGIDNGMMVFKDVVVPRENLMNRSSDVTPEGDFVTSIDPNKRFGASMAALSGGRVGITNMACTNMKKALAIGIRYSAVRKQFGPPNHPGKEIPGVGHDKPQIPRKYSKH